MGLGVRGSGGGGYLVFEDLDLNAPRLLVPDADIHEDLRGAAAVSLDQR